MLLLLVVCFCVIGIPAAKQINILYLAYLTDQGAFLSTTADTTAAMIVPIAMKHFNERSNAILPLSDLVGTCNATLNLYGGIFDDEGLPGDAMLALVGESRFLQTDIILGPFLSTVRISIDFFLSTNVSIY